MNVHARRLDSTTVDIEPVVDMCRRFDCGRQAYLSSLRQLSRAEFERQHLALSTEAPAQAVIAFVESEIAKDSRVVGPPVQAIRLTRDGISWLKREGPCRP